MLLSDRKQRTYEVMNTKIENQRKIIEWINDGFSLSLSGDRTFDNPIEIEQIPSGSDYIVNFVEIFQVIKKYIREHVEDFYLGDFVHSNLDDAEARKVAKRPWWSPIVPPESRRVIAPLTNYARNSLGGWELAQYRKIQHTSGNFIHPGSLSEEQFEELKKLIPNACQVKGCCSYLNFGPGHPGTGDGKSVTGGICKFHRKYPNYKDRPYIKDTPSSPPRRPQRPATTSSTSTTQTIQFTIKSIEKPDEDTNFFFIELDSPITVNGHQVNFIDITGEKPNTAYQNGDLRVGKTVIITNLRFSRGGTEIINGNQLSVAKRSFGNINAVSSSTTPPSPDSPPIPPSFPEVMQKNQALNQEETKMFLLVEELLKIIEYSNKIYQEAQQLGLNLPEISTDALNYFQEEFFEQLDESQALNSSQNSQIDACNEIVRKKKLNIKKNIYGIYDNNKKKLAEAKTGSTPPKNELEKIKEEFFSFFFWMV